MASIWQNNKTLRKWEKKNYKDFVNGDFNYNLAYPLTDPLISSISNYIGVEKEYIYVGVGISQFINAILGLMNWKTIFLSNVEFALYKRTAEFTNKNIEIVNSKYTNDFVEEIKKMKSSSNDLLCISSPRWFSGESFTKNQIEDILKSFKGNIIIDEAYVDFSDNETGMLELCLKNKRIFLLRSFSKKFFASGFRTGYMVTISEIEGIRNTLIPPHSVTSYCSNFFTKLLNDQDILKAFDDTRTYIKANRDLIYESLKKRKDIEVIKSDANFITLIFENNELMEKVYNNLNDLAGIQKFDTYYPFIKIWVNNEVFSRTVIKRVEEVLK